ncbi:omega-amidase NIT2-like [Mercenaria mercenaria]|uniref:omega-amidase NIT2-like n=1 Tax=Mercenaria mercenaria TaxID=6596 RepID=UPI001E1E083E|nr:omega-amidase NIT2-like [Mercenaria mercenaria]XP_045157578.1 omega-amidase NIT2-like [Mercenaria mercenaria]XP_053395416.1 omega-amidase NIT2-like [Mercenaria mercenaria]
MTSRFKLALVQLFVERYRERNLAQAAKLVREAAKNGARVIALPEYFTCWMDPDYFWEYREPPNGPSAQMLSQAAKENNVYLFGGTFPEVIPGSNKLYNTCQIYNPRGDLMARFRKLHLFDVDLGPRMKITESELNEGGDSLTTVDTEFCKTGFGVCIDLRYPEIARLYGKKGCHLLTYMGGFSMKTGPDHWEILQRVRAVDNQMFVASVGPATNTESPYVTYGHSAVADPWGNIIAKTGADEDIVYADIDLDLIKEIRRKMPLDNIRRNDLYDVENLMEKQS